MTSIHTMSDGPGLILFMGRRTEHADVSIQRYVPEVVYIITSEEFRNEHEDNLEKWAEQYDLRTGDVKSVDDLFESTAVGSLLQLVAQIRNQEDENGPNRWYVGLTGGTMHMAATAVYASILMEMQPFYVIRPPIGTKQMPNRDVLEFPGFNGISAVLKLLPPHLNKISDGEGTIEDLVESGLPAPMFYELVRSNVVDLNEEDMKWTITESGKKIVEYAMGTPLQKMFKSTSEKENDDPSLRYIT